jgi:DNA-binding MarR family transcriptional regulator
VSTRSSIPELPDGLPDDARHRVANLLNSTAVRLLRSIREADEVMYLTSPQASILSVLVFGGPHTIGSLADREHVSSPAITRHVDNLERRELVERKRSAADRRVVEVRATEAGVALLHRGRAARVRLLAEKLGDLDDAQMSDVTRALDRLVSLL